MFPSICDPRPREVGAIMPVRSPALIFIFGLQSLRRFAVLRERGSR